MKKENVVICPPCGENVALATKRGSLNKEIFFTTLLPRLTAVLPPQGREITTRGFTLIELLVVVLIIGILAAVAVPQYQKAVIKSRFATIKDLTQSIAQAEEIYYLANGQYTHNADELDINMPTPTSSKITTTGSGRYFYPWGYCIIENKDSQKLVYCTLSNEKNVTSTSITNRILAYWIGLSHDNFEDYVGKRACFAYGSDANSIQDAICKKETDKKKADVEDTTIRGWYYE